ncbi:MAG: 5'/3'-nucleotidase SurE [Kordiimonas sp.]|nr:5'/3'-nucleotidase SurE [Kordiimonas sp.]
MPFTHHRILVTNDDGIHAPGLEVLHDIAQQLSDDIWIIAPEVEQSGMGHALTLSSPVRYRKVNDRRYAVQGTPTDCVMMGVHKIIEDKRPTLVLSGVNRGSNLAEDMTYSGTIAAAMEGAICGIPSIALSQEFTRGQNNVCWDNARHHAPVVIEKLLHNGWDDGILMNINFPPCEANAVRGIRTVSQGFRDEAELFVDERDDVRGGKYYWFGFRRAYGSPMAGTDLEAINTGYISVTPLHLDLTHEQTLHRLKHEVDTDFEIS